MMKKIKLIMPAISLFMLSILPLSKTIAGPFGSKGKVIVTMSGLTCCKYAFFYNQCDRVPKDCGG